MRKNLGLAAPWTNAARKLPLQNLCQKKRQKKLQQKKEMQLHISSFI
jgi:hypothetical protein